MTNIDALRERRNPSVTDWPDVLCHEAADEIERLRAENERLRGLLTEYMQLACSQAVTDEDWSNIIEETACALSVPVPL